jgi:hypothetical protein
VSHTPVSHVDRAWLSAAPIMHPSPVFQSCMPLPAGHRWPLVQASSMFLFSMLQYCKLNLDRWTEFIYGKRMRGHLALGRGSCTQHMQNACNDLIQSMHVQVFIHGNANRSHTVTVSREKLIGGVSTTWSSRIWETGLLGAELYWWFLSFLLCVLIWSPPFWTRSIVTFNLLLQYL